MQHYFVKLTVLYDILYDICSAEWFIQQNPVKLTHLSDIILFS